MAERREDLRAADVDRQFVADALKSALDEGRLSLGEYDDRLKEAYAARTYGDLDKLLADLPKAARQQLVPPAARQPQVAAGTPPEHRSLPHWIIATWGSWFTVALIMNAIWFASAVTSGHHQDYWPIWVLLPWGAVTLASTARGLVMWRGGQYYDPREDRRRDRRERRRARRGW